jgi:hypothetical protein
MTFLNTPHTTLKLIIIPHNTLATYTNTQHTHTHKQVTYS